MFIQKTVAAILFIFSTAAFAGEVVSINLNVNAGARGCENLPVEQLTLKSVREYIEKNGINGQYTVVSKSLIGSACELVVSLQDSNYTLGKESTRVYRNGSLFSRNRETREEALSRTIKSIQQQPGYVFHVSKSLTRTEGNNADYLVDAVFIYPKK